MGRPEYAGSRGIAPAIDRHSARIDYAEITSADTHERLRPLAHRWVIDFKRARRVELGHACLVFETRETILFYMHEVLRADGMWRSKDIERVVDELQPAVPMPGQLTATLLVEGGDASYAAAFARKLHAGESALVLRLGARHIPALAADVPVGPLYPLHYVRFEAGPSAARALSCNRTAARLVMRAGGHAASASLAREVRDELATQLRDLRIADGRAALQLRLDLNRFCRRG